MSTQDNLKALEEKANAYYLAVRKLEKEMLVNDFPGDFKTSKELTTRLKAIRNIISSASILLEEIEIKARTQSHIDYHFRERLYLVRRQSKNAQTQLTLDELNQLTTDGPFTWQFYLLDVCRKQRDYSNTIENKERPNIRGWRPGAYIWEIWGYDPVNDIWSLIE